MNADQRVRLFIGDVVVQLHAALAQIEEMKTLLETKDKELAELKKISTE